MNQINVDALATKSANWAAYVQYVADHPAIAATYHVEYDDNGNAIGGLPKIPPVVDIPLPSYASPPTYDTLPSEGLSNETQGSMDDVPSENAPQIVIGGLPKTPPVVDMPLPSYTSPPTYNTLPSDGLSNMTRGSTVDANAGNTPQTVITNSPTVVVNAQTNANPGDIAMTASREVGRLYAGGSGI